MEQTRKNEVLLRNVELLSRHTEVELAMMPAGTAPLPSVEEVRRIVSLSKDIIFTDYFHKRQHDEQMRSYHIGETMEQLYELLLRQVARGLQFCEDCTEDSSLQTPNSSLLTPNSSLLTPNSVHAAAEDIALRFIDQLPEVKRLLYTDVEAMFNSDPAATNYGEVIYCYPVMNTMTHFRLAHVLHMMKVPVIPRIITELAHSRTGIDIHPGAQIGEYFAIDHGTGVVIGETTIIGDHVTLYQGVTLGAKSFKYDADGNMLNIPRHPIIEDHVTIYSNASILGRITIGHHSVIGGNIWVTNDVPPYSRIQQGKAIEATFQGGLGI